MTRVRQRVCLKMFVQTKSSSLNNRTREAFETVVFKSKKTERQVPNKKQLPVATVETSKKEYEKPDIKKLRYEVIKFGSSGFDGSKKEESRVALAVALGAKPPKKKYRNYVEILAERKAKPESGNGANRQNPKKRFSAKATTKRRRNKGKETGELLGSYGKIQPS